MQWSACALDLGLKDAWRHTRRHHNCPKYHLPLQSAGMGMQWSACALDLGLDDGSAWRHARRHHDCPEYHMPLQLARMEIQGSACAPDLGLVDGGAGRDARGHHHRHQEGGRLAVQHDAQLQLALGHAHHRLAHLHCQRLRPSGLAARSRREAARVRCIGELSQSNCLVVRGARHCTLWLRCCTNLLYAVRSSHVSRIDTSGCRRDPRKASSQRRYSSRGQASN